MRPALVLAASVVLALASGCARHSTAPRPAPAGEPRTWTMGFSNFPPRFTQQAADENLAHWLPRADEGLLHLSPDWASMLAGFSADTIVGSIHAPVAALYRARGLAVSVTLDATDGTDRRLDAPALRDAGRSLTEPAIQQIYRDFALAVWRRIHPDHLVLAAEVNAIRRSAPPLLYDAVRQVASDAHADLVAAGCTARYGVSLSTEFLWGRDSTGVYRGPAQDLTDFPWVQELGLSVYPYLGGYADPEDVPLDYFARVATDAGKPVRVVEGGWSSVSFGGFVSDPVKQARWLRREFVMLDSARATGLLPILFADVDLTVLPPPQAAGLAPFASIGLTDPAFVPKPGLAAWDSAFARPYR